MSATETRDCCWVSSAKPPLVQVSLVEAVMNLTESICSCVMATVFPVGFHLLAPYRPQQRIGEVGWIAERMADSLAERCPFAFNFLRRS